MKRTTFGFLAAFMMTLMPSVATAGYYVPYKGDKPIRALHTWYYGGEIQEVGQLVQFCDGSEYFSGEVTVYVENQYYYCEGD